MMQADKFRMSPYLQFLERQETLDDCLNQIEDAARLQVTPIFKNKEADAKSNTMNA